MRHGIRRPTPRSNWEGHTDRLNILERRTTTGDSARIAERVAFSYAGTLAVSTSGGWDFDERRRLLAVVVRLRTAGSSSTVVTVYRNGASIGTVTLGAGVLKGRVDFAAPSTFRQEADWLSLGITTAGAGAADLVARALLG